MSAKKQKLPSESDTLAVSRKVIKGVNGEQQYPEIRLCGRWLEELGFTIGERARVTITRHDGVSRVTVSPATG